MIQVMFAFPDLKSETGPVFERLSSSQASPATLATWKEVVRTPIEPDDGSF